APAAVSHSPAAQNGGLFAPAGEVLGIACATSRSCREAASRCGLSELESIDEALSQLLDHRLDA
ncbi:hypothetical protein, partial [Winogradskya consettensis]|uniref:hypothetical protein n=1 Tax=Winogradskya consettensis TaxID=113560 RepID=UPI0031D20BB0